MKRPYCCDDSRDLYEQYYGRQQKGGGDFPIYVGRYSQRGHGIGNLLGSLFRRILPVLKAAAPHVLRTGANIVQDVASGQTWRESAIKRVPETLRAVRPSAVLETLTGQTGSGKRKRRKKSLKKTKRCKKDIFDGVHS